MKVFVLPSTFESGGQALAGLVVNDTIALDAGSIGLYGTAERQGKVRTVLLTHSHLDHIATLPILIDNVYQLVPGGVEVCGLPETIECLRRDIFNDRFWPDFFALSKTMPPFLRVREVQPGVSFEVDGLRVTPFTVPHGVPAVAYLLEEPGSTAIAYVTDTASADVLLDMSARASGLRAVFLEASFPTRLADLARITRHLTVHDFLAAARALPEGTKTFAVHLKPRYHEEVAAEIRAAKQPNTALAIAGRTYRFK